MDIIFPFLYEPKKEELLLPIPLYIEDYYLPIEKTEKEEEENNIIVIQM